MDKYKIAIGIALTGTCMLGSGCSIDNNYKPYNPKNSSLLNGYSQEKKEQELPPTKPLEAILVKEGNLFFEQEKKLKDRSDRKGKIKEL